MAPTETINQENPTIHGISSELLSDDEDIFRRLYIPWFPSGM